MTLKCCQYCGLAYESAMHHDCPRKKQTMSDERPDLDRLVGEAGERYAAMSPIERAIHDLEQRRSGARGLAKMSTPREELDTAFDAVPEFVLLRAYREASTALAAAERRIEELERQWRAHRDSALRWEKLYREATGARDEEPDDEIVF